MIWKLPCFFIKLDILKTENKRVKNNNLNSYKLMLSYLAHIFFILTTKYLIAKTLMINTDMTCATCIMIPYNYSFIKRIHIMIWNDYENNIPPWRHLVNTTVSRFRISPILFWWYFRPVKISKNYLLACIATEKAHTICHILTLINLQCEFKSKSELKRLPVHGFFVIRFDKINFR